MSITAAQYIYRCAQSPNIDQLQDVDCLCSTCAAKISQGVPISKIENPTFSQHSDKILQIHLHCLRLADLHCLRLAVLVR